MQFCNECGGALNLFETNDSKLCWSCTRKRDKAAQPIPQPPVPPSSLPEDLADAILCLENGQLVLKAKEGWVLWSCPATEQATLATILKRAGRIHQIRSKRTSTRN